MEAKETDPDLKASQIKLAELEGELISLKILSERRLIDRVASEPSFNGQFHFIGAVHESAVHNMMASIDAYHRRVGADKPIEIILNSGGGSVIDGLAFVDYLKSLPCHVRIVGTGMVASMAGVILQAANERVLTSRCHLGMHEIANGVQGSLTAQEDNTKYLKMLQGIIVELLCSRSTLTHQRLRSMWKRKDVNLTPPEALRLGLIDSIQQDSPVAEMEKP